MPTIPFKGWCVQHTTHRHTRSLCPWDAHLGCGPDRFGNPPKIATQKSPIIWATADVAAPDEASLAEGQKERQTDRQKERKTERKTEQNNKQQKTTHTQKKDRSKERTQERKNEQKKTHGKTERNTNKERKDPLAIVFRIPRF